MQPVARLAGHSQIVNSVVYSPNGNLIASASFDNTVKLWNGADGSFMATLRGHVAAVYQVQVLIDSFKYCRCQFIWSSGCVVS